VIDWRLVHQTGSYSAKDATRIGPRGSGRGGTGCFASHVAGSPPRTANNWAALCPSGHVDRPGEVIAWDLQFGRPGGLGADVALHDGSSLECREEGVDKLPDSGHGGVDVRHPVDAQRHLVGDLRDGLTAITEPDRPVVILPGRQAAQDLLRIKAMAGPQLLPDPLPARPAAARGNESVTGDAQETTRIVRERIKQTGHAAIEPPCASARCRDTLALRFSSPPWFEHPWPFLREQEDQP
jgi:hypothetical protein